ncbi:MAG: Rpn family recombination-promoting nuclease/putative transposase [Treponema sp.]|nr:Rpn family recombination-promoting nuclease/putative transposase [Treponema sp.]
MEILHTIEAKGLEPLQRFNPLNDFLFYKVMGEKGDEPQLTGFLNAVLGPSGRKPITSLKILENRTFVRDMLGDKSCALDVRAVLADKTQVNIEVQLINKQNMDRRSLFYWGKMYTKALKKGRDYLKLPDVIAVNIVDFDFPPGGNVRTCFRLREDSDPSLVLTTALEIHFVNMVRWRKQGEKDVVRNPLHRWLAWFDTESPPELVEEVKGMDAAIAEADEKQEFVMQDEDARDYYERRQKAERDRISDLNGARLEGELKLSRELLALLDKGYTAEDIRRELASKG